MPSCATRWEKARDKVIALEARLAIARSHEVECRADLLTEMQHFSGATKRESEVLQLIMAGCSNKEIAERLNICERTAKFHVSAVLKKQGVSRRVELFIAGPAVSTLDTQPKAKSIAVLSLRRA